MIIETKFNIGDIVRYDNDKRGKIIGYEIRFTPNPKRTTNSVWYEIQAMTISEQVFLDNRGALRYEESISKIEPEPFIKEGNWYVCLHPSKGFVKGRCYKATKDGSIEGDNAYMYVGNDPTDFRPATEYEILKAKFASPELPEIVKEKVREITEKPTVSWDSVNGTLTFCNLTKEQEEKLKSALIGEPKQELTEFDSIQKIIHDLLSSTNGEWLEEDYMTEMSKNISEDIRKQIAESIDVETMKERFINNLPVYTVIHESVDKRLWGEPYKKGIKDTLNKIKGR